MLSLDGIGKRYADKPVLQDLSLDARPGELLVVAGPNGSGKSTLLRIMAGLVRPDRGTVTFSSTAHERGYLGHETFLYPNLTALENLAFWQRLHKKPADEQTLLDALDDLGLAAFADEKAGTFSRGTAQRLSLVRVFLQSPAVLLLDEPLSGLDAASSAIATASFARLMEQGTALVLVTHAPLRAIETAAAALILASGGTHRLFPAREFPELIQSLDGGKDAPC